MLFPITCTAGVLEDIKGIILSFRDSHQRKENPMKENREYKSDVFSMLMEDKANA